MITNNRKVAWPMAFLLSICLSKSVIADESTDKEDIDAIKKLTPKQMQTLNKKLQKAMALYYDQSYRLAKPLLQDIALQIETTDVAYWLGMSAYHTGDNDMAIEKFSQIVAKNPAMNQVRLDLAMAYLHKGDGEAALEHLKIVLASNPPEPQKQKIEEMIAKLSGGGDKKYYAFIGGSFGLLSDNNISGQTDSRSVVIGANTILPIQDAGWARTTNLSGKFIYDIGEPDDYVIDVSASYLR